MMYLSRIELDITQHNTMRALASPHVMHAAIENCFRDRSGAADRKLWRVDRLGGNMYLLLLSHQIPNFENFVKQFCGNGRSGETKSYDSMLSRIREGQQWRFRLKANPVHSVKNVTDTTSRGKIYAHVTTAWQKNWLRKKASVCGFEVGDEMYDVVQSEQIRFKRLDKFVTLGTATFEGILSVREPVLFSNKLIEGIGRAKAYGCGLLTIA
jgi:CRISPR system Cascade subunit CasE